MKPNEFDELIRRKFDQNEFEYNPANWDRLDDRLDKKATRRRILMWLPLAPIAYISSVAASLAMIITIPVLMQHNTTHTEMAQHSAAAPHSKNILVSPQDKNNNENNNNNTIQEVVADTKPVKNTLYAAHDEKVNKFILSVNVATATDLFNNKEDHNTNSNHPNHNSFSADEFVYGPNNDRYKNGRLAGSISVIGGFNRGGAMNGYSIGANGKKMLSDKLYVEGDIAFVDNTGIQNKYDAPVASISSLSAVYPVQITDNANIGSQANSGALAIASTTPNNANGNINAANNNLMVSKTVLAGARIASDPVAASKTNTPVEATPDIRRVRYDLYYAQLTPAVGYHLHKNLSIGVGADVQRLLEGENKMSTNPNVSTAADLAADNKLVPGFDVGLVGKTEVALTDKIKASVYYRQGMNNVVNPGNKFIDRSYLQVHLRFTIFGK